MKANVILKIVNTPTKERSQHMDKKELLLEKLKKYAKKGIVDITKFRLENQKEYNLLAHHFGGINQAIDTAGLTKVLCKTKDDKQVMSIRNQLAYDMFNVHYNHKFSVSSLSIRYQSTNATVANLFKALCSSIGVKDSKELKFFELKNDISKVINQSGLRDKMALDYLNQLRNEYNLTLESIGGKYNCSRSAIDQLHRSLIEKVGKNNG